MKKIITILTLFLIISSSTFTQVRFSLSLQNPGTINNIFYFDVVVTVFQGNYWHIGSSNVRVFFNTIPAGGLTVHPDSVTPWCGGNYATNTISISGGTGISFNIVHITGPYCNLSPGTYYLGRIRFNRLDSTVCTTDSISPTSIIQDSLTILTYGNYWTANNPPPCVPVVINKKEFQIPDSYKLYDNYPNPFNPLTSIKFDIPKSSFVKLFIYDLLGREVELLVNERKDPGNYEIQWDASNYASGLYFYKLETVNFTEIKKMVLLK